MFEKLAFFFYKILYFTNLIIAKLFNRNFLLWFKEFIENDHYIDFYINNKNIKLFTPNNLVKWRNDTFFDKEPETIEWIKNFKLKKFYFWDIGSNIGQYSLYCALIHPGSSIISFEPSANNLRVLSRNIGCNKLEKQITIFPIALTNKVNNFLNLLESSSQEGSAHNSFGRHNNINQHFISYKTYGTSIDYIIEKKILPIPNYIKIDVDGIEESILQGGIKYLSNKELLEVSIEINENEVKKFNKIKNIFFKSKFKIKHKKHNHKFLNVTGSENTFNYIFKKTN